MRNMRCEPQDPKQAINYKPSINTRKILDTPGLANKLINKIYNTCFMLDELSTISDHPTFQTSKGPMLHTEQGILSIKTLVCPHSAPATSDASA
jgi:hypothetical protein